MNPEDAKEMGFADGQTVRLCEIRQCALKKGVETCGDCEELEKCRTVGAILADNPEALKKLKG